MKYTNNCQLLINRLLSEFLSQKCNAFIDTFTDNLIVQDNDEYVHRPLCIVQLGRNFELPQTLRISLARWETGIWLDLGIGDVSFLLSAGKVVVYLLGKP